MLGIALGAWGTTLGAPEKLYYPKHGGASMKVWQLIAILVVIAILVLVGLSLWGRFRGETNGAVVIGQGSIEMAVESAIVVQVGTIANTNDIGTIYQIQAALRDQPEIIAVDRLYKRLDLVPAGTKVPPAKMVYRPDWTGGRLIIVAFRASTAPNVRAQDARQWLRETEVTTFTDKAADLVISRSGEIDLKSLSRLIATEK